MLESNWIYDLGCSNGFFTWSNRQADLSFIEERLDKCVANNKWKEMFRGVRVEGLPVRGSYHLHVLVLIGGVLNRQRSWRVPFRFEASWVQEEECEQRIR